MFTPRTQAQLDQSWPPELDHISANSLKTFSRCPEVWRRRYCQEEKQRPAAALIWGSADHTAIAADYRHDLEEGGHLQTKEVQEIFASDLDTRFANTSITDVDFGNKFKSVMTVDQAKKETGRIKDEGVKLVTKYHEHVSPHVNATAIEKEFEYQVPGTPVKLVGYIDLIGSLEQLWANLAGVDYGPRLIDRKTSGRMVGEPSPEWQLQGQIYQLIEPLPHDWHISVKGGNVDATSVWLPAPTSLQLRRTEMLVRQLVTQIGHLYWTYGPNHPWPGANTRGFMWGGHPCNFCGFRSDCAWW